MSKRLVSVIVPAYNSERYLVEALESALRQDYEPKEIVVVDDGSTDATPEILARYAGRIVAVRQKNQGSAVARNTAIAHAKGEYLAFLDADDLWLPGKLSAQAGYLDRHENVGMVYARWGLWNPSASGEFEIQDGQATRGPAGVDEIDEKLSGWLYNELLLDCVVLTSTAMLRRSVAQRVGGFESRFRRGQDYDYWLRTSQVAEIHKLAGVYTQYRIHGESITHRVHQTNYGYEVLRAAVDRYGGSSPNGQRTPSAVIARRLAQVCFDFGYQHLQKGDPRTARASFARSIRYVPWRPKSWLLWAAAGVRSLQRKG